MNGIRYTFLLLFLANLAHSQHLYLEGFSGMNKSDYGATAFEEAKNNFILGGRFAFGADHFQIGAEYRMNMTDPSWESGLGQIGFSETYYGGFLRTKLSKYPAKRFGLVLMAGAGYYSASLQVEGPAPAQEFDYDPILGINGGAGFSIPLMNKVMLELGYRYNFLERPAIEGLIFQIESHKASYHSFQLGLSYNLVFGKRADEYQQLEGNSRYGKG